MLNHSKFESIDDLFPGSADRNSRPASATDFSLDDLDAMLHWDFDHGSSEQGDVSSNNNSSSSSGSPLSAFGHEPDPVLISSSPPFNRVDPAFTSFHSASDYATRPGITIPATPSGTTELLSTPSSSSGSFPFEKNVLKPVETWCVTPALFRAPTTQQQQQSTEEGPISKSCYFLFVSFFG